MSERRHLKCICRYRWYLLTRVQISNYSHHPDSAPFGIIFQMYTPCLSGKISHRRSSINMSQIEFDSSLELESNLIYNSLKRATKPQDKHRHMLEFCPMELLKANFITFFLKALQSNCLFICVQPHQNISSLRMKNMYIIATSVCCSPVPST